VQSQIDTVFSGGADFIAVGFDPALAPKRFELSLKAEVIGEENPEYIIEGMGRYQRLYRFPWKVVPVSRGERALLDVAFSTFSDLANRYGRVLTEPLPPRFRRTSTIQPADDDRLS